MSKEACAAKVLLCWGTAVKELETSIQHMTLLRDTVETNRAIGVFEEIEISEIDIGKAEDIIKLNKKIKNVLMS